MVYLPIIEHMTHDFMILCVSRTCQDSRYKWTRYLQVKCQLVGITRSKRGATMWIWQCEFAAFVAALAWAGTGPEEGWISIALSGGLRCDLIGGCRWWIRMMLVMLVLYFISGIRTLVLGAKWRLNHWAYYVLFGFLWCVVFPKAIEPQDPTIKLKKTRQGQMVLQHMNYNPICVLHSYHIPPSIVSGHF